MPERGLKKFIICTYIINIIDLNAIITKMWREAARLSSFIKTLEFK